jgi:hypothetical protein
METLGRLRALNGNHPLVLICTRKNLRMRTHRRHPTVDTYPLGGLAPASGLLGRLAAGAGWRFQTVPPYL